METQSSRPLTEDRRRRVTCWFVGAQLLIIVSTLLSCLGPTIHTDTDLGDASAGIVGLLVVWAISSWLVLTFGWIGVYMAPAIAWSVIGTAAVVAVMSGIVFFALSIFTTPVLLLVGSCVRGVIVAVQRWMGIRLVPGLTASPAAAVS